MRPLSVQEMIRVWERGNSRSPIDQALLLLDAGSAEDSLSHLAKLHVAERDRRLLQLREKTFGSHLSCSVDCPWCSEDLHFEMETRHILQAPLLRPTGTFSGDTDDVTDDFRLPNSEDPLVGVNAASLVEGPSRIL